MLQTPEYAEKMQPDEDRILDMPKIVVLFTEEPEVFIGDDWPEGRARHRRRVGHRRRDRRRCCGPRARRSSPPTSPRATASSRSTSPTRPRSTRWSPSIVAEHGRLDLAANVAGTSGVYANVADSATADWRQTMAVNLDGVYFCLRAELRAMRAAGAGRSSTSRRPPAAWACPAWPPTRRRSTASSASPSRPPSRWPAQGIRVNAVCPGSIRTPMLRGFVGGDEDALEKMGRRSPMGRLGEPERDRRGDRLAAVRRGQLRHRHCLVARRRRGRGLTGRSLDAAGHRGRRPHPLLVVRRRPALRRLPRRRLGHARCTTTAQLFELLCLEGSQAGLSWITILRKRPAFQAAFEGFDPEAVAAYGDDDVARLLGRRRHRPQPRQDRGHHRQRPGARSRCTTAGETLDELVWSHGAARRDRRPSTIGRHPADDPGGDRPVEGS